MQVFVHFPCQEFFNISKKNEHFIDFAKHQFLRLLVPFFIFSTLYAFILFFLEKGSLLNGLYKTITFHGAGMQLYFLPYLFGIGFIFSLILNVAGKNFQGKVYPILLMFFLVLICVNFPTSGSTGSDFRLLPFYFLAYVLGFSIRNTKLNYLSLFSVLFLSSWIHFLFS